MELYPVVGAAILKSWDFGEDMVRVPQQHLDLNRTHDGPPDFTDVVQVSLIETVAGTDHPLGQVDRGSIPAYHRIGMDTVEEIDISGGVVEVKEAIA